MENLKIAYFGGEPIGVPVLEELKQTGFLPSLVVCNPDRPVGRKQVLTPPPVKVWAKSNDIEVFQPESLKDKENLGVRPLSLAKLTETEWDLFVVVAYGLIMPKWLIDLPKHGTLNVHPSLLPKLRGASPIRTAILEDMRETGVTIMQMDEKMDHGPIIAQQPARIPKDEWPLRGSELDHRLASLGGQLLSKTIPKWIAGDITPQEQNHEEATFSRKIEKSNGELQIDPTNLPAGDEAYQTLLKIRAYDGWLGTYFYYENKRIKITDAELSADGHLQILSVIPEGKKEMSFETFVNSGVNE